MRRKRQQVLGGWLALILGLTLLAGCGSDENEDGRDGRVGRSYVYGTLDGALASQLMETFAPRPWRGETDGSLLISADTLLGLSETQKTAAQAIIKSGQHAVLVTRSRHPHVEALHALTGAAAAISLDRMSGRYVASELYGFAQPHGKMRMIIAPPFADTFKPESDASKQERAEFVATWILEKVREPEPAAQTQASPAAGPAQLSSKSLPWQLAVADTMAPMWSTCDIDTQQCTNQVQLYISAWMVYSASAAAGQPTDYFVVQMAADINTAGCKDFYGNRNHSDRIAAYWLRQANMSASAPGVAPSQMDINPAYAPVEANPSTTVTTGTTWSLSGTGTAGTEAAGSSLAFSAGVSYSDERTATYQALQTQVNIGATGDNTASWTYDSWDFVHAGIEPGNRACGGPGLRVQQALPSIIYGGTFTPLQSWVWQAQPSVRQQFAGQTLPVTVNTSLLLGWTYYSGGRACGAKQPTGFVYLINDNVNVDIVGSIELPSGNPYSLDGLNFDVSCDITTNFGTIPLGPAWQGQNNAAGNPGTPYALPAWAVNIPFAPTAAPSLTLTGLSPTRGSAGTVVTLTGTNLGAATTVNFGGTAITQFALTPQGAIQVVAPQGTGMALVSVGNASGVSNTLSFTYTP